MNDKPEVKVGQLWRFLGRSSEDRVVEVNDDVVRAIRVFPDGSSSSIGYYADTLSHHATLVEESPTVNDNSNPLGTWSLNWRSELGHQARIDSDGALVITHKDNANLIVIPAAVLVELAGESAEVIHELRNK